MASLERSSGQTHLYGWVDIDGIELYLCDGVTPKQLPRGWLGLIRLGVCSSRGLNQLEVIWPRTLVGHMEAYKKSHFLGVLSDECDLLRQHGGAIGMGGARTTTANGLVTFKPDPPQRDFFQTLTSLPQTSDQADTDAIFAGFGLRSHFELAGE